MSLVLCATLAAANLGPLILASPPQAPTDSRSALVQEALGYKKLTLLHKELREMDPLAARMCAPASSAFGPHLAYMRNYVTPGVLAKPLPRTDQLNLPIGTLIVKEKFAGKQDSHPTLITAMKKTKKGTGASAWTFVMIDMKTKKEVTDPKQPCLSCHKHWTANDGISGRGAALIRNWQAVSSKEASRK